MWLCQWFLVGRGIFSSVGERGRGRCRIEGTTYQSSHLQIAQPIRALPYTSSLVLEVHNHQPTRKLPPSQTSNRAIYIQAGELTNVRALACGKLTFGLDDRLLELQETLSAGRAGVERTEEFTGRRSRAIAAIVVASMTLVGFARAVE